MGKPWMGVFLFLVGQAAGAGPVFLTEGDIARWKALIPSSPEVQKWTQGIQDRAQEALSQTPHPIQEIQTAGQLQGSSEKAATQEALKDMPRLRDLGLAFVLTGRKDFGAKAQDYLLAWAKTCQPPGNPIDATNLEPWLETYDLLRPHVSASVKGVLDPWVRSLIVTLQASDDPKKKTYWNNWKSHRLKIEAMAAFLLEDKTLEDQVLADLKALLAHNLHADGTTLDLQERDALHYQVYDLEPLLRTAVIYERAGTTGLYDLKTDEGASIRQCVAFVVPFAKGEKTHAEYVHTTVKFDLQRAQNHEKGHAIGADFEPKAALKCLELAEYFQTDLKPLVADLAGKREALYPTLQILVNEVTRPVTAQP